MMYFCGTGRVRRRVNAYNYRLILLFSLGTLVFSIANSTIFASDKIRTVAFSGTSAPVPDENAVFGDGLLGFRDTIPVINSTGQTAFQVNIDVEVERYFGSQFYSYSSILREDSQLNLELLAISEQIFPLDIGIDTFRVLNNTPVINASGRIAFNATFDGIFREIQGGLQPFISNREQAPSPIEAKELAVFSSEPAFNNRGQTVFFSGIFDPGASSSSNSGFFITELDSGDVIPIAIPGDQVVGLTDDIALGSPSSPVWQPNLNNRGQTSFSARFTGTNTNSSNDSGIFLADKDEIRIVAREGDLTPIVGADLYLGDLQSSANSINSKGHQAFSAWLTGEGVDFTNDRALFRVDNAGKLTLVAREGDPVPIAGVDISYQGGIAGLITQQNDLVFSAQLTGEDVDDSNRQALFRQTHEGSVDLIARQGDLAPLGEGDIYFGFSSTDSFRDISVNGSGQVVFSSGLSDGSSAIFAENRFGELKEIIRTGEMLNVSDDPNNPDLRRIIGFEMASDTNNADGRRSAFNDRGQIAFTAVFADYSAGVFVSNLVAVPEPSSCLLMLSGLVLMLRRSHATSKKAHA